MGARRYLNFPWGSRKVVIVEYQTVWDLAKINDQSISKSQKELNLYSFIFGRSGTVKEQTLDLNQKKDKLSKLAGKR